MNRRTARRCLPGAGVALAGVVLAALVIPGPTPVAGDEDPWPGMAGVDTSLPATASAVTVNGRGAFAEMEITVNQTEDLTNQAISITWTGAPPTDSVGLRTYFANFVQIMQCWGEPDELVPTNPGPPPEHCVWGSLNTAAGGPDGFATSQVTSRAFSHVDFPDFDPDIGTVDESGEVYRDFVAVDGTLVTDHVDHTAQGPFDQYWLNPYFDSVKSNEVPGVRTLSDGRGQALFTVNTGLESSGLGCGQRVQPSTDGARIVPRCWLVLVPRGTAEVENAGIQAPASEGVASSPMHPAAWQNRVAVELDFTPIDSPCDINADQRRINGSELAMGAVTSWQPLLCTQPGLLPYAYGVVPDGLARQQLLTGATGAPGMVAVNRPVAAEVERPDNPIVYAPLTASALGIGFYVERISVLDGTEDLSLQGVRFSEMNLTPRLVAKLLTQSYRSQVEIRSSRPYEWDDENPIAMFSDPDFLRFNPEFTLWQSGSSKNAGGLILPAGNSDVAREVWAWILADDEAAAWLSGAPDEWGMAVNPVYATAAENNTTGFAFGTPVPESFPKSDPYCYQAPALATGVEPPLLCALDWFPYASGFAEAARLASVANDAARTTMNPMASRAPDVWRRGTNQTLGRRTMLGLTDLPSVTRFGLQAARLSQADDGGADRAFVAPDAEGLGRALLSMSSEGGLLHVDHADVDAGAYPLTTLTYAAVRPLALDADAREDYAAFLDYAAGPGQVPGYELGQLPPGYLPLPSDLAAVTAAAAETVRTLAAPRRPGTSTTTITTTSTTTSTTATAPPTTTAVAGGPPVTTAVPVSTGPALRRATNTPPATGGGVDTPAEATSQSQPPPVVVPATTPQPTSRQLTPVVAVGNGRYAVIAVALTALLSALLFLEITKGRPRRAGAAVSLPTNRP